MLCSPLLILIGLFVYYDPFKIIYEYDDYSSDLKILNNRDFVSSRVFEKNYPRYQYNSFLFGSSRTMAFNVAHWKKHLDSSASVYSFDAFGESIFGIYTKLMFLDEKNVDIKNCLLIFCEDATFQFSDDHPGHLYMKDPLVAKTSYVNFYFENFKAFIGKDFFVKFCQEKIFGWKVLESYNGNINVKYDTHTNAMSNYKLDFKIKKDADKYYKSKGGVFYKRLLHVPCAKRKINGKHITMLKSILTIFKKHHTNYKIIISPLYSQIKFNPKDLAVLQSIFGQQIYDYSGKNKITNDFHNYYESSHYLPRIGDSLMNVIYCK